VRDPVCARQNANAQHHAEQRSRRVLSVHSGGIVPAA
jgi:hypothetical protein